MQFLSPPERSIRDSAHAVDIYLAVHTEIPLKMNLAHAGECWGSQTRPNLTLGGKKRITDLSQSRKTAFMGECSESLYGKCIV